MADKKISELTALTGANVATDDQLVIVDTSAALTKSITIDEFKNALDTATGFVRITGDTMTGNLSMGDNVKAIFGAGSDLQIYHDGSRSIIQDNGTGNLRIQANNLELNNADNSENYLFAANNGAVTLYYDNAEKFNTTSTGVSISGNATFPDNGKAIFGAGSDLQIYHNPTGSHSYITESGGGSLYIQGTELNLTNAAGTSTYANFVDGGAAFIRHAGSTKMATSASGIDVTGTVTADGLTVDGDVNMSDSTPVFTMTDTDGGSANMAVYTGSLVISADSANEYSNRVLQLGVGDKSYFNLADNGDISFREDTGTTAKFFWDASAEGLGVGYDPTVATDTALSVSSLTGGVGTNPVQQWKYTNDNNTMLRLRQIVTSGLVKHTFDVKNTGTDYNNNLVLDRGNVGIGTSSPATAYKNALQVHGADGGGNIRITNDTTGTGTGNGFEAVVVGIDAYLIQREAAPLIFYTNNSEAMRIDNNGKVIIGNGVTADTGTLVTVGGAATFTGQNTAHGASRIKIGQDTTAISQIRFYGANTSTAGILQFTGSSSDSSVGAERMRIDASGNLLVGKTTTAFGTQGVRLSTVGSVLATSDGNAPAELNRLSSDGDILGFYKDGSTVGSIGVDNSDNLFISGNSSHSGLMISSSDIIPYKNGAISTGTESLGTASFRWKDLYLSGGVYLGGTGSANKLDDYEEGTWTPTSSLGTITVQGSATYTKIGNLVTVYADLRNFSERSSTAAIRINGLPFTSTQRSTGAVMHRYISDIPTNGGMVAYIESVNYVNFLSNGGSTNWRGTQYADLVSSSAILSFTITYRV
jgi:hypothetical protein